MRWPTKESAIAIYHANVKAFSRGKGESATAAAAYRAGIDIADTVGRTVHRYSRRKGVASFHMLAPKDAPKWCLDAHTFWDANEAWEDRANARVCREVEVALPSDLGPKEREALALALGQALVDRYQVVVLVAIHEPSGAGDQRNHHVHLLMSARQVDANGLGARACAEFDARAGKGAEAVREVRAIVSTVINEHLAAAGLEMRVDHRTLRAQASEAAAKGDYMRAIELTRLPTKHVGRAATAMLRRAQQSQRVPDLSAQPAHANQMEDAVAQAAREGRLQPVSPAHSHDAACRDAQRERLAAEPTGSMAPNTPRIAPAQLTSAPVPSGRTEKVARSSSKWSEVLNAEAAIIEEWLAQLLERAQEALRSLQNIPGLQVEAVMLDAIATLEYPRAIADATHRRFREWAELLTSAIEAYVGAILKPHQDRDIVRRARARLSEAEIDAQRGGAELSDLRSKRRKFERATQLLRPEVMAKTTRVVNEARKSMMEATHELQQKYPIAPAALEESPPEKTGEEIMVAGDLEFRPPPGTMLRPRL